MASAKAAKETKEKRTQQWKCLSCGYEFSGSKTSPECPSCSEKINLAELTKTGAPKKEVRSALGDETFIMPIKQLPTDPMADAELMAAEAFRRDMEDTIRDGFLERERARALDAKLQRIVREKQLETAAGGVDWKKGTEGLGAALFFSALAQMKEEDRTNLLERLSKDPQLAINLGMLINPPNISGMTPFFPSLYGMPSLQSQSNIKDIAEALKILSEIGKKEEGEGGMQEMAKALKTMVEAMNELKGMNQVVPGLTLGLDEKEKESIMKKISENPGLATNLGYLLNPYPYRIPPLLSVPPSPSLKEMAETLSMLHELTRKDDTGLDEIKARLDKLENIGKRDIEEVVGAVKSLMEFTREISGTSKDTALERIEKGLEELKTKYYDTQVSIANLSKSSSIDSEELVKLVDERVKKYSPTEALREANSLLEEVSKLVTHIGGGKGEKESYEEWLKKHQLQREEEEAKRKHEAEMKTLEAQKTKYETAAALISAALARAIKAKEEEKTQN